MKAILFLFLFFSIQLFANEITQKNDKKSIAVEDIKVKEFIQVSEVSSRSVATLLVLKEITKDLEQSDKLVDIHESLSTFLPAIDIMLKKDIYKNLETLNVKTLQQMQSELSIYSNKLTQWNTLLESEVDGYVKYIKVLEDESLLWTQTNINAKKKKAPKSIKTSILSVMSKIKALKKSSKKKYDRVLTDSNNITSYILKSNTVMENLKSNERNSFKSNFSSKSSSNF